MVDVIVSKIIKPVVELSHELLSKVVGEGSLAIDATLGNGYDTLFLAKAVGSSGKVFAFDIQDIAIRKSLDLLTAHGVDERVELFHHGHEEMDKYISTQVQGIVFNLGYLPGQDQRIITEAKNTVTALTKATRLLIPGGLIVIVVYWGHQGGMEEKEAVENWITKLSSQEYDVIKFTFPNKKQAPYLIGVQKKIMGGHF